MAVKYKIGTIFNGLSQPDENLRIIVNDNGINYKVKYLFKFKMQFDYTYSEVSQYNIITDEKELNRINKLLAFQ